MYYRVWPTREIGKDGWAITEHPGFVTIATGYGNMATVISAVERANRSLNPTTHLEQFLATIHLSKHIYTN